MNNKKWLVRVVSLTAMLGLTLGLGIFAACTPSVTPDPDDNPGGTEHTHSYTEWAHDDTQHWKVCPDDNTADESTKANHIFVEGVCECGATENGDQPDVPDVLDQREYFLVGNGQGTIKNSNWALAPAPAAVTFTREAGTNTYTLKNFELMVGDEMKLGFAADWGTDSAYAFGAYFFSKASDVFEASTSWADNAAVANGKSGKYNITLVTAGANTSSTAVAEEQIVEFKFELVESYEVTTEDMGWYLTGAMNGWSATGPTAYKLEETSKGSGIWEGTFNFLSAYEMKAIHFTKTVNKGVTSYAAKWSNEANHSTPQGAYKMTYNANTDKLTHTASSVPDTYYTITFVTNGGTPVESQQVKRDGYVTPPVTTKEGFTLVGWYTDEGLTEEFNFSTKIRENVTLYAKWQETVKEAEWVIDAAGKISAWLGSGTEVTIPAEIDGTAVETLAATTFANNPAAANITKLTLKTPVKVEANTLNTLTSCTELVYDSDATDVKASTYRTIGRNFAQLPNLSKVTFTDIVTEIPSHFCKSMKTLKTVVLSDAITVIPQMAFQSSGLESFTIPATVKTIEQSAFASCASLTSVTIPASVTTIDANAFQGAGLTSLVLPTGVTTWGNYPFQDCASLTTVTGTTVAANLPMGFFKSCTALKSVELPEGVINLELYFFSGCTAIETVVLPATLEKLYSGFESSCAIKSLTVKSAKPPMLFTGVEFPLAADGKIYVPAENVEEYKAASNWSKYADSIEAIPAAASAPAEVAVLPKKEY